MAKATNVPSYDSRIRFVKRSVYLSLMTVWSLYTHTLQIPDEM